MVMRSIFIPLYNEERIIERNAKAVHDIVSSWDGDGKFELFIVDDASKDKTEERARRLTEKHPEIKYIRFENGPSRRENLGRALLKAKGDTVIFLDADLATDLSALKHLVDAVEKEGYDIAIGDRYHPRSKTYRSTDRKAISVLYNAALRLYFGSRLRDHQCGFKAFRREALFPLLKEMGYDRRIRRGWFWDAELLIRAQRKGFRIRSLPVRWREGEKTTFSPIQEIRMIPYVLRLRFRL
ncbi:MAG: glycosyltransferase [archaeon]